MRYALLIYDDDSTWADLPDDDRAALRAEEMPKSATHFGISSARSAALSSSGRSAHVESSS